MAKCIKKPILINTYFRKISDLNALTVISIPIDKIIVNDEQMRSN